MKHAFSRLALLLLCAITLATDAGIVTQSGPRRFVTSGTDTTPDAFTFTDQTGVATSSTITSAAITVSGINAASAISVSGGSYDVNASGSFTTSSGNVNNGDTVRARHTSSASNSTATNTTVTIGGVSDTFTSTTTSGTGNVIFDPGDLGSYTTPQQIFTNDVNRYGAGDSTTYATVALQSTVTRPGGSSKAILITYPQEEAGTENSFPAFTATKKLYIRWYMMLGSEWAGNLPVGLKIVRTFTTSTYTATVGEPGVPGDAYSSPKLWNLYQNPDSGFNPVYPTAGNPSASTFWGACIAAMNLDVGGSFSSAGLTLSNNAWHLYEIYQEMNSADGVADGKLEMRVDKTVVYQNNAFKWVDGARYVSNGLSGWRSMWFGGNYSGGDYGRGVFATPLKRYEDGYRVTDYADWVP